MFPTLAPSHIGHEDLRWSKILETCNLELKGLCEVK